MDADGSGNVLNVKALKMNCISCILNFGKGVISSSSFDFQIGVKTAFSRKAVL